MGNPLKWHQETRWPPAGKRRRSDWLTIRLQFRQTLLREQMLFILLFHRSRKSGVA